jgi:hypothetical protein
MKSNRQENVTQAKNSAFEKPFRLATETESRISELQIVVLFTSPEMTREALRYAATLGDGLRPSVRLIDVEVVPYGCSLDQPSIDPKFARERLEKLAMESGASTQGEVLYARDRDEALVRRLTPGSLVLIPVKGYWGRICQKQLMRNLARHGHDVVLVPCR